MRCSTQVTSQDTSAFFPIPKYYDGQARVRYQPEKHTFVELGGMISSDDVSRTVGNADPAYRKEENKSLSFQRLYLRYETETADGGKVSAMPWLGWDRSTLTGRFGGTPTVLEVDSRDYGFRASYRGRVAPFLTAEVGLDLEAATHSARRVGSVTAPPREGDARAFGQPPSDQINLDTWQTAEGSAAPYVEGDFSLFEDKLHIVPGLRLEPQFTSVSKRVPTEGVFAPQGVFTSDTALEPRLAVRYAMSSRVTFKAAFGQYRQAAQPQDLSASFGNPTLQSARATHLLFGGAFELNRNISLETTVFRSTSDGLAVRNPSSSPLIAQALVNGGEGRSYGVQFLLRHELAKGFFGWVAYTILRSERKDAGKRRLSLVRLRSDARAHRARLVRSRQGLRHRRARSLRERLPAHAGGRLVLRLTKRDLSTDLGRQEFDSYSGVRRARRARRQALQVAEQLARNLSRRAKRVQSQEPGRDRVQRGLHAAALHRRPADLAGAGHQMGVLSMRVALRFRRCSLAERGRLRSDLRRQFAVDRQSPPCSPCRRSPPRPRPAKRCSSARSSARPS